MNGQLYNCNGVTRNTATLPAWARILIASLADQRTQLHRTIERLEMQNNGLLVARHTARDLLIDAEPHTTCNCSSCATIRELRVLFGVDS